ncbi:MAG TPA: hypothetical protein VMZ28_09520 [Kofleriaceae bacterium]|nr:hypothetical protein [Kofleriaceae bacterium]
MRRSTIALALLVACGGDKDTADKGGGGTAGTASETAVTQRAVDVSPLPLGVANPADLSYVYGKGAGTFKRALDAAEKKDWAAARSAAEETLQKDATHLDAHHVLAVALAQQGEYEKSLEHLRIALAGDWTRWGADLAKTPDLEPLVSSPLGGKLTEMLTAYRDEFAKRARGGLLVVARRAPFKAPEPEPVDPKSKKKKPVDLRLSSRAEVFAYDVQLQRYLRLTQTGFQVLAFLPSPSGDEIAYVSATRLAPTADGDTAGAVLAKAEVGTVQLASAELKNNTASFTAARALAVEYRTGDQLIAAVTPAKGAEKTFSIERATGKTKPAPAAAPDARRLVVRYEEIALAAPPEAGVAADWVADTGTHSESRVTAEEFMLDPSKQRVQLPAGQAALGSTTVWSADRSRLAFATAADPCAADAATRQAALYVVDAESGKLKHVASSERAFMPRFVDAALLAYQDDEGAIHLYDAAAARETARLATRGELGMLGVQSQRGRVCWSKGVAPATPATASPGPPPPPDTPPTPPARPVDAGNP